MPTHQRILLAEDDPVSRDFLADVLAAVGSVSCHRDGASALHAARAECFDLLVLDCRLPHLGGHEVLRALRSETAAASRNARAIALSADLDAKRIARLQEAGFETALTKPIARATLLAAACGAGKVAPHVSTPCDTEAVLDDASALAALGGNRTTVARLRALFAAELPGQLSALQTALQRRDVATAGAILHRLRASAGFCGATELAAQARRLAASIDGNAYAATLLAFDSAADRLRRALGGGGDGG